MSTLIDMHSHILPAVDDGSDRWETTGQMLRSAYEDGIDEIILTPHYKRQYSGGIGHVREQFQQLQAICEKQYPELRLHLGTEAMYEAELADKLARGDVLTMAGSQYILLEYPPAIEYSLIRRSIKELMYMGRIPILAHVERYTCIRKNTEHIYELDDMGALLQINADSVLGKHGFGVKQFCKKLLSRQMISFVASDAHDACVRKPMLSAAAHKVAKKYGQDYADELFVINASRLLHGEKI